MGCGVWQKQLNLMTLVALHPQAQLAACAQVSKPNAGNPSQPCIQDQGSAHREARRSLRQPIAALSGLSISQQPGQLSMPWMKLQSLLQGGNCLGSASKLQQRCAVAIVPFCEAGAEAQDLHNIALQDNKEKAATSKVCTRLIHG